MTLSVPAPRSPSGKVYQYSPNPEAVPRLFLLGDAPEDRTIPPGQRHRIRREPGAGETICPYSGYPGPDQDFTHFDDIKAVKDYVQWLAEGDVHDLLGGHAADFNRRQPRNALITMKMDVRARRSPPPLAIREDLLRSLDCDVCQRTYAVYALALFCPDCGAPNVRLHFQREIDLVHLNATRAVLFAEQANTALQSHRRLRRGKCLTAKQTKFEKLSAIWGRLLPHRTLVVDGDDINVKNPDGGDPYTASQMSDGERAMFYLIAQTLVAADDSVLIVDEPELHVHPAAMTALWDEFSAARPDCVFVFITHSLEFAASRPGPKYSILEFHPDPDRPSWTLEDVPEETGFGEDFTTLVLGSRRPVLFVEGNGTTSLDHFVYRAAYPDHLVLPRNSASEVIHAVASLRTNPAFTRVSCWGLVDRDNRSSDEIDHLRSRRVYVLPVAEIENVFLLPDVARAIAASGGYESEQRESLIGQLRSDVLASCASPTNLDRAVVRAARRYIDRHLKRLDLTDATTTEDLDVLYQAKTAALNITNLTSRIRDGIQSALNARDLPAVLERYDDKGLFALAAQSLRDNHAKAFKKWLERVLTNGSEPELAAAISGGAPRHSGAVGRYRPAIRDPPGGVGARPQRRRRPAPSRSSARIPNPWDRDRANRRSPTPP